MWIILLKWCERFLYIWYLFSGHENVTILESILTNMYPSWLQPTCATRDKSTNLYQHFSSLQGWMFDINSKQEFGWSITLRGSIQMHTLRKEMELREEILVSVHNSCCRIYSISDPQSLTISRFPSQSNKAPTPTSPQGLLTHNRAIMQQLSNHVQ